MPPARESRLIEQRILVPTGSAIAILASLALSLSAQPPPSIVDKIGSDLADRRT